MILLAMLVVSADPYSYVEAKKRHDALGVPLVVMVTADWCGPCQVVKKDLRKWAPRAKVAYSEVEYDSPQGKIFRKVGKPINSIPRCIVFCNGRRYWQVGGFDSKRLTHVIEAMEAGREPDRPRSP